MSPADVALSKGLAPKPLDPKRTMVSPVTGQVIGTWTGAVTPKKGK